MKKAWFKKGISILLAGIMVFSMAACGKDKQQTANNEEAKKYVFRYENLDLGLKGYKEYNVSNLQYLDGKLYVFVNAYDEMWNNKQILISMNPDGTNRTEIEIKQPNNEGASMPDVMFPEEEPIEDLDAEEPVDDISEEDSLDEDTADTSEAVNIPLVEPRDVAVDESFTEEEIYVNYYYQQIQVRDAETILCIEAKDINDYSVPEAPVYKSELTLVGWDMQCNELWRVPLESYKEGEDYFYIQSILTDSKGNIYLFTGQKCISFDKDGNNIGSVMLENQSMSNFYLDKDENVKCFFWNEDYTTQNVATLDVKTGKTKDVQAVPSTIMTYNLQKGQIGYDFMLSNNNGLYGYNMNEERPVQIMSFINSDLNTTYLEQFIFLEEGKFVAAYYDQSLGKYNLALFTAVAPEDIPDKQAIIVGCYYMDWDVRNRIVAFNKASQEYRIVIKEYYSYNTQDDWQAGLTQLNNDILAGNTPDILMISSDMPVDSYISKGILADLNKFIEKDEELDRNDYLQNVLETYSVDGKLYQLVPSFIIQTCTAKEKWVGDRQAWTIKETQEVLAKMPEGATLLGENYSRETMLNMALMYNGGQYVDKESGKCSFDSQEFMDLLAYVATFPAEKDISISYEGYWDDSYEVQWREDRTLLNQNGIYNIWDFNRAMQGYFGEPYTLIGFPAGEENGSVISPTISFAISAKSPCKDGAWEFVRYYLTDEYQDSISWGLPLKEEALNNMAMKATQKQYWEDENGNKEEYDDYFWIGGEEIIIEPMTEAEAQALVDFIKSVDKSQNFDTEIINIVTEEAAAFFEGQKSVEDVTKIIQNRVQNYVYENR